MEEKTLELMNGSNNGTFQLDSSGTNLIFAFYSLDGGSSMAFKKGILRHQQSNEECEFIFRSNSVSVIYTADCGSNIFPVILCSAYTKNETIRYGKLSAFIIQEGTWSYSIEITGSSLVRLDVWFESSNAARIETWTSSFQNNPIDWRSNRVIIYASVSLQQRAISGTNLVAYVVGDGSTEMVSILLNENDPPDVTKGDGIYSAMLTTMPVNSTSFSYVVEIINGTGTVDNGI